MVETVWTNSDVDLTEPGTYSVNATLLNSATDDSPYTLSDIRCYSENGYPVCVDCPDWVGTTQSVDPPKQVSISVVVLDDPVNCLPGTIDVSNSPDDLNVSKSLSQWIGDPAAEILINSATGNNAHNITGSYVWDNVVDGIIGGCSGSTNTSLTKQFTIAATADAGASIVSIVSGKISGSVNYSQSVSINNNCPAESDEYAKLSVWQKGYKFSIEPGHVFKIVDDITTPINEFSYTLWLNTTKQQCCYSAVYSNLDT